MRLFFRLILLTAAGAGVQGCANSSSGPSANPLLTEVADKSAVAAPGASGYALSGEELDYDCKKLTGKMQLRILQIRDEQQRDRSTLLARAMNAALGGFVGSTAGADPEGRYVKEVAQLRAYNAQLAAKGCKTYDLNAELVPKDFRETPAATVGGAAKTKK